MRFQKGHIVTAEHRKKISQVQKGNTNRLGKLNSEESKKKVSEKLKGTKRSEETKEKISRAQMGNQNGFPPGHKINSGRLGNKASNWKGGKIYSANRYIYIYQPIHPFCNRDGYVFEHRLVMEGKLGRYLKPEERVHHIDGNKINNNENNLMLFSNEAEHQKYENCICPMRLRA